MDVLNSTDKMDADETRDTLLMFGGVALMMMGAGLVLTSPIVRRYLGGLNLPNLLQAAGPDFERYLKLKSM